MRANTYLQFGLLLLGMSSALAADAFRLTIPDASVVGRGTLSYAFWTIYDATLFAPQGKWERSKPYALSLNYHWTLEGKQIADRSVQEIRQQGFQDEIKLATWHHQMKTIFPDVNRGTVLTAVYMPGNKTLFYHDNKLIGAIKGDEFAQYFFDIWLGDKTSAPELRRGLLGQP